VPEPKEVLDGLTAEKFQKTQAFLGQPVGYRAKTNNHVARVKRQLRFDAKVRYKFRKRQSVVRWVLLKISRYRPQPKPLTPPDVAARPCPAGSRR
jgi:hypothetical protein